MRRILILALILVLFAMTVATKETMCESLAGSAVNRAADAASDSFMNSISEYFAVPKTEVANVRQRNIAEEDIPVVFFISRKANVAPKIVSDYRLKGQTWQQISNRYGFGAESYHVPLREGAAAGPPYGKAYGYYKNKPQKDWNKIKLADDDIVNLVNLRFMSGHYNYPAEKIMEMRKQNKGFKAIGADIEKQRDANKAKAKSASDKKKKDASAAAAKKKQSEQKPKELTGVKKQINKFKQYFNKKERKTKKYMNDKG